MSNESRQIRILIVDDHPLLRQPALLASPHTAGVTHESRARVATMAAEAFIAAAAGRLPPRCLNPEVADRFHQRLGRLPANAAR